MKPPRHSHLSVFSVLLLFTFISLVSASISLSNLPNLNTITQPAGGSTTGKTPSPSAKSSTSKDASSSASTSKSSGKEATTGKPSTASTGSKTSDLTGGSPSPTGSFAGGLSGVPTIAGVGIPTAIIPNTANAPFMQKSTVPEGTVFIAVGAALGFLGMCILAWRGFAAWSLHRSVKRAATAQYMADKKVRYQASAMHSSQNLSLENLTTINTPSHAASRPPKKTSRQSTPNSSLFFSPTAGAGLHGGANRTSSSTYLPAGFYASGSSAPAAGSAMSHLGGGPPAAGYGRLSSSHMPAPSPPDSPNAPPYSDRPGDRGSTYSTTRTGHLRASRSGSNLAPPSQQRAPSSYLDDLFDNRGNAGPRERY